MKKENLPEKFCAVCGKPMTWLKRWAKVWQDVKYCSDRCRRNKNSRRSDELDNPPRFEA